MSDLEKLMKILSKESESKVEIPLEVVEKLASENGINKVADILEDIESRGLVSIGNGKITIISKRLFW